MTVNGAAAWDGPSGGMGRGAEGGQRKKEKRRVTYIKVMDGMAGRWEGWLGKRRN